MNDAVTTLTALAQEHRLAIFRLLVQQGPEGLAASEIAARIGLAAPTLSFHLKSLSQAGLIRARQEGRYIYYAAAYDVMNELLSYLTEHCCQGESCAVSTSPPPTQSVQRRQLR